MSSQLQWTEKNWTLPILNRLFLLDVFCEVVVKDKQVLRYRDLVLIEQMKLFDLDAIVIHIV